MYKLDIVQQMYLGIDSSLYKCNRVFKSNVLTLCRFWILIFFFGLTGSTFLDPTSISRTQVQNPRPWSSHT